MWSALVCILVLLAQADAQDDRPVVNETLDQFCNIANQDNCRTVIFTGDNFTAEQDLSCEIVMLDIDSDGQILESSNITKPATFVSGSRVDCDVFSGPSRRSLLQSEPISAYVSLKDDFGYLTGPVLSLVYPELCFNCSADGCTPTGNGCYINGECMAAFTIIRPGQICDPRVSVSYGTIAQDQQDIVFDSCGTVHKSDLTLSPVDRGYSLPVNALGPLSNYLSLEFFGRFPFGITQERVVAQFGDAITILQAPGHTLVYKLQFTNSATGELVGPVAVSIDLKKRRCIVHRLNRITNRLSRKLARKLAKHGSWEGVSADDDVAQQLWIQSTLQKKSFGGWLALLFDPATAQLSFFYKAKKLDVNLGMDLTGLQLLTNGEFFISSDTFVCMDLSTEHPPLYKKGQKLRRKNSECKAIIEGNSLGRRGCNA